MRTCFNCRSYEEQEDGGFYCKYVHITLTIEQAISPCDKHKYEQHYFINNIKSYIHKIMTWHDRPNPRYYVIIDVDTLLSNWIVSIKEPYMFRKKKDALKFTKDYLIKNDYHPDTCIEILKKVYPKPSNKQCLCLSNYMHKYKGELLKDIK